VSAISVERQPKSIKSVVTLGNVLKIFGWGASKCLLSLPLSTCSVSRDAGKV